MSETIEKPPSFKPEVTKEKDIRGRIRGYVATFCGWESSFRSKTKEGAVAELRRKLTEASVGDYAPEILAWRGFAILMCRHPVYGWGSRIIQYPDVPLETQVVYLSTGSHSDKRDAKNAVLYQLAQNGWQHYEPVPEILPLDMHREFETWAEFQNRFHTATATLGMKDDDARAYAGRDPARPELWRHLEGVEE